MTMFSSQWFAAPSVPSYEIDNSLLFDSGDGAYLTRTQDTGDSQQKGTFSWWMKRCSFGEETAIIAAAASSRFLARFSTGDELTLRLTNGTTEYTLTTDMVFRDPSAWYHCVWRIDVTQAVAANRSRLYVNGSAVTFDGSSLPAQDTDVVGLGDATTQRIGILSHTTSTNQYNGYLAEFHYIDNASLDASSFGETNDDGVWVPKEYDGAYGTNGFFLEFGDSSAYGDDTSGNGNDFTSYNFGTSGLFLSQKTDTPTDNFCILNFLYKPYSNITYRYGNLRIATTDSQWNDTAGTIAVASGKFYWEVTATTVSSEMMLGVCSPENAELNNDSTAGFFATSDGWGYYDNGDIYNNNSVASADPASYTDGDVLGFALNLTDDELKFYKNNSLQYTASLTASTYPLVPALAIAGSGTTAHANFGQVPFSYTPPTGHVALSTANLTAPAITDPSEYYQTGPEYAGNASTQTITFDGNADMQPDIVWIKATDGGTKDHVLTNSVRGTGYNTVVNLTLAEDAATDVVTAFNSDGFALGDASELFKGSTNSSSINYVSWNWKESATAGMDIVTWTGNATNRTISHSLGVVPNLMIVRGTSARDWMVYHSEMSSAPETDYMRLDSSAAIADESTIWNDTAPTSSVFSVGTGNGVNADTETYIGYLFANVEGFSKFGSYTGNNNSDGPFLNCGFKPNFLIVKKTASGNWMLSDTRRNPYNPAASLLFPSTDDPNTTGTDYIDFLSNGCKFRHTGGLNGAADYIFIAFAENPFGGSGIAPTTAR